MAVKIDSGLQNDNRNVNPEEFAGNTLGGKIGNTLIRVLKKFTDSITDWFEDRLVNFSVNVMKKVEKSGSVLLSELVKELKDKKAIPEFLKPLFDEVENPQHEFGALLATSAGSSAIGGLFGAIFDPLMAGVKYQLMEAIHPMYPSYAEGLAAFRRGTMTKEMAIEFLDAYGIQHKFRDMMIELSRSYMGFADIRDSFLRGDLTEGKSKEYLGKQGFESDDVEKLFKLFIKIPDIASTIQAYFRGDIKTKELTEVANKNGITKEYLDILVSANTMVLNINDIREVYYRDHKDDNWLTKKLTALGLTTDKIDDLKKIFPYYPGVQDLIRFAVREVYSPEIVSKFKTDDAFPQEFVEAAAKAGLSEEQARNYWRAHWDLPSPQMGFEMLHRGIIDLETLKTLLRVLDVMPFWQDKLIEIAYNPLTRVDIRRMHKTGVVNDGELVTLYKAIGYSEENATRLQQFTIRLNTVAANSVGADEKELTKAEILDGYARKFFGSAEATSYLTSLGYDSKEVEYYLTKVDYKEYLDIKKQQLDIYEEMYKKGVIDDNTVIIDLGAFGLEAAEINYNLYKWALSKKNKPGKPSLLDLKTWLKLKIIDAVIFATEMSDLGYSEKYINLYYKEVLGKEIAG